MVSYSKLRKTLVLAIISLTSQIVTSTECQGQNYYDHFSTSLERFQHFQLNETETHENLLKLLNEIKVVFDIPIKTRTNRSVIWVTDTLLNKEVTLMCYEWDYDFEVQMWEMCNLVRPYIEKQLNLGLKKFDYAEFLGDFLLKALGDYQFSLNKSSIQFLKSSFYNGISVDIDTSGFYQVVFVQKESSSYREGIRAGDVITKVSDVDTRKLGLGTFNLWTNDTISTTRQIEVKRGSETLSLNLSIEKKPQSLLDLTIEEFKSDSIEFIYVHCPIPSLANREAFKELVSDSSIQNKHFIVDLTNYEWNSANMVNTIPGLFLEKGDTLFNASYRNRFSMSSLGIESGIKMMPKKSNTEKACSTKHLWLICDETTPPDGELIVLALGDLSFATTIGKQTKGHLNYYHLYCDKIKDKTSCVQILTSKYYTKSKSDYNGTGIMPDIIIEGGNPVNEIIKRVKQ